MSQNTAMTQRVAGQDLSQAGQLSAVVKPHLQEQLRLVFDLYEGHLLAEGAPVTVCCELRRGRRHFIEGFVSQWVARCEALDGEWVIGSAANAAHTRTHLYLTQADRFLQHLYDEHAVPIGRLAASWQQFTGKPVDTVRCPLAPHAIARLFFLFLPELPVAIHIRDGLARMFLEQLPAIHQMILTSVQAFMQRRDLPFASLGPVPVPESLDPLETYRTPSAAAQTLVAPARTAERVLGIADDIARAALAGDLDDVLSLLSAYRQTALMPWLATQLSSHQWLPQAEQALMLLAGPLVAASTDEHFADIAHPARRVLEEWLFWAPGWASADASAYGVAEQCLQEARHLSTVLVHSGEEGLPWLDPGYWLRLLDYFVVLRRRNQQEGSVAVASARLAVQVLEVRAEVESLLQDRGLAFSPLPRVVVEILTETWTTLLMAIHWREGTASDAWLTAVAVADELLASVQPVVDRQARMQAMQRVSHLLQQLRKGFDAVHADRKVYSAYLERLEQVHLALLQGRPGSEPEVDWPSPISLPARDEPFEVGQWLQEAAGPRWRVVFSDDLCTVLVDTDTSGLVCCSTASLQSQLFNGDLETLPSPPSILPTPAFRPG